MTLPSAPSIILVVDTSLQGVALALVDAAGATPSARLLWSGAHPENRGAVAKIAALTATGFKAAGAPALAGFAVGVGPGSFTGIKVGLAFVYGMNAARAAALPVLGISALDTAAAALQDDGCGTPLALFLPATRTHGYLAVAGGAAPAAAALVEVGPVLRARLDALPLATRLTTFGSWPLLAELIRDSGRSVTERAPSEVCRLAIYGMAEAAARSWPTAYSHALPEPRYLRPSTAEERRATQLEAHR